MPKLLDCGHQGHHRPPRLPSSPKAIIVLPSLLLVPAFLSSSSSSMARNWDRYSRQGLDFAHSASSFGFSAAKLGTRVGFSIARTLTSSAAALTTTAVDIALFGGTAVSRPLVAGAVATAFTLAEQITLAPIHLSEYLTSTSLLAAHSSINLLSAIIPGSSEASFSLPSFVTLVRREWAAPREGENWPEREHRLTDIVRAIVAWVVLQGVTQEWQEQQWFKSLKEMDVNDLPHRPPALTRKGSRIRVTSDIIFPSQGLAAAQIIAADIGEAPARAHSVFVHHPKPKPTATALRPFAPLSLIHSQQQTPAELKITLRRLSKMVLAGYGGASLLFFGVTPTPPPKPTTPAAAAADKSAEEAQLTNAIDASEAEAAGDNDGTASAAAAASHYSWWDVLLGRHDQEIFEHYATSSHPSPPSKPAPTTEQNKTTLKATAVIGNEHLMPRFWVLTDHNRAQIVLVLRGTMSLNEIAVDLTCEPVPFVPARTPPRSQQDEEEHVPGRFYFPSEEKEREDKGKSGEREETHHVHEGMLRMARAMGDVGKPVQLAVLEALHRNPDFELVLCGHSLGAGVAAILGMIWADPRTCLTVRSSGLPIGRRVHVYCFAPPSLISPALSFLSKSLITSFVYSHDVVARLSLGSVRDLKNAALWLCEASDGEGFASVTARAKRWKARRGAEGDMDWFIATRKTLEANMQNAPTRMYPPGRVLWGMRNSDLHPAHQMPVPPSSSGSSPGDKLRVFEVLDVERVFSQIVFARNMLTAHMPHQYDKVLHDLL